VKRLVKLLISLVVWTTGSLLRLARRLFAADPGAEAVVLYYHAIKPRQRMAFARQLDLARRYAKPWRLDLPPQTSTGRYVAVTFDDGFLSVVEHALPELRKRDFPFTVFFPTGSWGQRPSWIRNPAHSSWEERVLSREELRTFAADPLVTIGSHSITHPNFLQLDNTTAAKEFAESKRELETVLGKEVGFFSFPHGAHNEDLVRQARDVGYQRVFTVEPFITDPSSPGLVVGRVLADPDDWPIEFHLKLRGAYKWMAKHRHGRAQ
jgi:peptidoglycan/xylan/chitin deacetylase (PgdA/CDA1 family)